MFAISTAGCPFGRYPDEFRSQLLVGLDAAAQSHESYHSYYRGEDAPLGCVHREDDMVDITS
jgi:hypothetical protein